MNAAFLIALVTSLPIDLYVLDQNINQRIHEEQVLQQVPGLYLEQAALD